MIQNLRVFLWGIVAELEYVLYPWKEENPPQHVIKKYNLNETDYEEQGNFHYEWIKSHDDKISALQLDVIHNREEINKIKKELGNV